MVNKNRQAKVLARRDTNIVQSIVLDSRERITMFTCMNAIQHCLPKFYIQKGEKY